MTPVNATVNENVQTLLNGSNNPVQLAELSSADLTALQQVNQPVSSSNNFAVLKNHMVDYAQFLTAEQPAASSSNSTSGGGITDGLNSLNGTTDNINNLLNQMTSLDPNSKTFAADSARLQIQLQMAVQQQQSLITTLTNVVKEQGDTQLAIARNE